MQRQIFMGYEADRKSPFAGSKHRTLYRWKLRGEQTVAAPQYTQLDLNMLQQLDKSTRNAGFTLIELMVTIAILGIILSIGVPSMRDFLVSNRLSSDINSFIGLVNYARSEAITRNQNVIICPKAAGASTCASSVEWNTFEIQAFVDVDANADFSTGDVLLKTLPAVDASSTQTVFQRPTGTANPGGAANITFSAVGYSRIRHNLQIYAVKSGDTAYQTKYGRWLCVSQPGRVTVVGYVTPFTTTTCPT